MSQADQEDNLKLIKGIGTAIESRLHKAGINSYTGLTSQTIETLGNLIGYPSTKQNTLQGWIEEAKNLASKTNKKRMEKHRHKDISNQQRYATFTLEILLDNSDRVRRTQVVHVQSGEDKHWSSRDEMGLADYIVQKAKIRRSSQSNIRQTQNGKNNVQAKNKTDSGQFKPPPATGQNQLHTSDLQSLSVSISGVTLTSHEAKLHMQCLIELSGKQAKEITNKQSRLVLEVLAFNLLTSQVSILTTCENGLPKSFCDVHTHNLS